VVQTLGFLRWPFLVSHLAQAYLAPGASEAQRAAATMVFESFHIYAGMAIGEHLGYLSTSVWTFLIALLMLRAPLFGRWLGLSGMLLVRGRGSRSTTRVQMSEELFAAHRSGKVRVASVRASDLFGPHVTESLVGERLFGPLLAGKQAQLFANPDLPHSVSYIQDVGQALVNVGAHDAALGRAWHAPNAPTVTLREFVRMLGEEAHLAPQVSAPPRAVTRALLPLLGLAVPALRGLTENLYIGYEPYIVDHSAYTQAFGDHATPLREAIRATVQWYRTHAAHMPAAATPGSI
jgi:hypothetical protein